MPSSSSRSVSSTGSDYAPEPASGTRPGRILPSLRQASTFSASWRILGGAGCEHEGSKKTYSSMSGAGLVASLCRQSSVSRAANDCLKCPRLDQKCYICRPRSLRESGTRFQCFLPWTGGQIPFDNGRQQVWDFYPQGMPLLIPFYYKLAE